jgi:hypothetical protein
MKVPISTRNIPLETPTTRPVAMPQISTPRVIEAAFGADVGKAYEGLGEGLKILAAHVERMAIDKQDQEVLRRETAYRQELQDRLFNRDDETIIVNGQEVTRKKGVLLRQLGQADGATKELKQVYQKELRPKYLEGLSKYQADKLGPALDNHYLTTRNSVITHEANQLDEDFKLTTKSNLERKVMDASLIRDNKQLSLAIDDAVKTIAPYNRKYDPATQKIQNDKAAEDVAKAAIISTIEQTGNYQITKTMLDGIKNKISPATLASLSDEIGKRAADMAIAGDMSVKQEDSIVMKELQKGKDGAFSYLSTTERNKAIKESQQKIFYNSQIAKKENEELQKVRHESLIDKFLNRTATLADIENEMLIPEEAGGLKKSVLLTYQNSIQRGIKDNLSQMLTEKNDDKEPTKRARMVKEYLSLINGHMDTETDRWKAREELATAYADGVIDANEQKFLNKLKSNLNDPMVMVAKIAIKGLEAGLKMHNAAIEDVGLHMKQLVGMLSKGTGLAVDTVRQIIQQHALSKIPEAQTFPEKGQLMMDGFGNKFIAFWDGHTEPYIEKPKTETKPAEKK